MASATEDIKHLGEERSIRKSMKEAYESLTPKEKKSFKREMTEALTIATAAVGSEIYSIFNPYLYRMIESIDFSIKTEQWPSGIPVILREYIGSTDVIPLTLLFLLLVETNLHAGTIRKFYGRFKGFYSSAKERAKEKLSRVV
jgi:hypothetical protein